MAWLATLDVMNAAGQGGWRLTDLELLPGGRSGLAAGVNDDGVVVGVSETADRADHAVVWRAGRSTDLGTFGGRNSVACDLNRHGVVVGWSETPEGRHAFMWRNGQLIDLGGRGSMGGTFTSANAINDRGWVVGGGTTAKGRRHAFMWWADQMIDLGTLAPGASQSSHAYGVDDRGRIVGTASVDDLNTVAVLWENGRIHRLTYRFGQATAINSRGQVAICASPACFVSSPDKVTVVAPDEGPAAVWAQKIARSNRGSCFVQVEGIDRDGRVVGWTADAAFVWHRGQFEWLPHLSTGQTQAIAISDQGQFIAGSSVSASGDPRPVVWTRQ